MSGRRSGAKAFAPYRYATRFALSSLRYQFIGSGSYLYRTYEDPAVAGRMCPLVYATLAESAAGGGIEGTALVASAEPPPATQWTYDGNPLDTDDYLTWTPHHQPDGMGNRQWYSEADIPDVATQWQQGVPLHAFGWFSGGSNSRFAQVDMGYDLGVSYFGVPPGEEGQNATPDSDWYQAAGVQTVAHEEYGTRRFIVMVDSNNDFYCFPADAADAPLGSNAWPGEKANVNPLYTQSQACPWPAWVTQEAIGVAAILASVPDAEHRARLRPLWHFNRTGTRAACIAGHRAEAWSDAYFESRFYSSGGTLRNAVREDYPGLVEVSFAIAITGENLEDFAFSVSLARDIDSATDHQCPVAVGYALRDSGDCPENALVMLEYRHYTDTPACSVLATYPDQPSPPDLYDLRRPNLAVVAVLSYWSGSGWVELRRWLAYYGCFPRRVNSVDEPLRFSPVITDFAEVTGGPTYLDNQFTYIAQLAALDLDSLSVGLAVTVSTIGTVPRLSGDTYTAEAVIGIVIAFNAEVQRETAGHPDMIDAAEDLYALTATHPNIASMTRFHLGATLDYAHYDPAWDAGNLTDYATLTVSDGDAGSWSTLVQDASEDATVWSPITLSGEFPAYTEIRSPAVFRFFDAWPLVRPGIRWRDSGGWQAGTLSFSGYPYAAVFHSAVAFLTLSPLHNVWQRIHAHRGGSYAYFIGPLGGQTEVVNQGGSAGINDIPDTYAQFVMDRIAFVDEGEPVGSGTHLGAINSAFGKSLSAADFHLDISAMDFSGIDIPFMRPASDDPTAHDWYYIVPGLPIGIMLTGQYLSPNSSLLQTSFCFDPAFVALSRHASYSSMATFPTPKMEGAFLPSKTEEP